MDESPHTVYGEGTIRIYSIQRSTDDASKPIADDLQFIYTSWPFNFSRSLARFQNAEYLEKPRQLVRQLLYAYTFYKG